MAEEPQPPNVHEGAGQPEALPANAEDRKAAQALSSLDAKPDEDAAPKKEIDLKALNDAMKTLGVAQEKKTPAALATKKEEAPKKLVKVDQTDVTLLVGRLYPCCSKHALADLRTHLLQADQLDISKTKATELLRAHDADAIKAMTTWVTSAV